MHNKELNILQEFFRYVTFSENEKNPHQGGKIYRDLVYYRFFEAITSIFPLTVKNIEPQLLEKLIKEFIQKGTRPVFIRDMADEFREFLCSRNEMKPCTWLPDLMWYEWTEAKLLYSMASAENNPADNVSFNEYYILSSSAVKRNISHAVYKQSMEKIDPVDLVVYYDYASQSVCYRTMTHYVSTLIENMAGKTLEEAFLVTSDLFDINPSDREQARDLVRDAVEDLLRNNIIIKTRA